MEEFHIPRKKNFASTPARATSSSDAAASSSNKGSDDDAAAGGTVPTPSSPSRSNKSDSIPSPAKSPGGRQILRRGDLVRLSNE